MRALCDDCFALCPDKSDQGPLLNETKCSVCGVRGSRYHAVHAQQAEEAHRRCCGILEANSAALKAAQGSR